MSCRMVTHWGNTLLLQMLKPDWIMFLHCNSQMAFSCSCSYSILFPRVLRQWPHTFHSQGICRSYISIPKEIDSRSVGCLISMGREADEPFSPTHYPHLGSNFGNKSIVVSTVWAVDFVKNALLKRHFCYHSLWSASVTYMLSVNNSCMDFGPSDGKVVLKPREGYVPKVLLTSFRAQAILCHRSPRVILRNHSP